MVDSDTHTSPIVLKMKNDANTLDEKSSESNNLHKLSDTWILWAHLPHDTDWSIKGGCFSYKISNKDVSQAWKELTYVLVGESMADNKSILPLINGITISPKKNFCIVKVWLASCEFRDSSVIKELHGISSHGCLFKEHMPEY